MDSETAGGRAMTAVNTRGKRRAGMARSELHWDQAAARRRSTLRRIEKKKTGQHIVSRKGRCERMKDEGGGGGSERWVVVNSRRTRRDMLRGASYMREWSCDSSYMQREERGRGRHGREEGRGSSDAPDQRREASGRLPSSGSSWELPQIIFVMY